jgi:hypothetical protein
MFKYKLEINIKCVTKRGAAFTSLEVRKLFPDDIRHSVFFLGGGGVQKRPDVFGSTEITVYMEQCY